jgi:hypothetical protein
MYRKEDLYFLSKSSFSQKLPAKKFRNFVFLEMRLMN